MGEHELNRDDLLIVGRVMRPHGVRGELKIFPETDDPVRLLDLERVFIGKAPSDVDVFAVERGTIQPSKHGDLVIMKVAAISDRTMADELRGLTVFAEIDKLPPLGEDEVFLHDLVGLQARLESGERIGVVREVLPYPAHDVLVIEQTSGQQTMVPAVDEFLVHVDIEERLVTIRPIEGLFD